MTDKEASRPLPWVPTMLADIKGRMSEWYTKGQPANICGGIPVNSATDLTGGSGRIIYLTGFSIPIGFSYDNLSGVKGISVC